MPKVLVLFYSRTGRTAAIADAIAAGAEAVKFTEVEVRRIDDLAPPQVIDADSEWASARARMAKKYRPLESIDALAECDALIIGSPARYGAMSAELQHTLDRAESLRRRGAMVDKVASAFGSIAGPIAGPITGPIAGPAMGPVAAPSPAPVRWLETHVASMLVALAHFGMIIVPPPPTGAAAHSNEHAARAGSGAEQQDLSLAIARQQGARVAKVAEWVRHAKSHEAHGHHH